MAGGMGGFREVEELSSCKGKMGDKRVWKDLRSHLGDTGREGATAQIEAPAGRGYELRAPKAVQNPLAPYITNTLRKGRTT